MFAVTGYETLQHQQHVCNTTNLFGVGVDPRADACNGSIGLTGDTRILHDICVEGGVQMVTQHSTINTVVASTQTFIRTYTQLHTHTHRHTPAHKLTHTQSYTHNHIPRAHRHFIIT
eukprot:GHVQ01013653.1.p1 GENE.GHVQ01013653.1~~GHVQ01013653.1.p1  ORF type:complete len:117 (-),score=20.54 GHVQ01013653.1:948-1298(-)